MEHDGRWWTRSVRLEMECTATWKYTMKYYGRQCIRLAQKKTERNWIDWNMEVLIWNMKGYEEYYEDGMKYDGLQHDNMIWNVIGVDE